MKHLYGKMKNGTTVLHKSHFSRTSQLHSQSCKFFKQAQNSWMGACPLNQNKHKSPSLVLPGYHFRITLTSLVKSLTTAHGQITHPARSSALPTCITTKKPTPNSRSTWIRKPLKKNLQTENTPQKQLSSICFPCHCTCGGPVYLHHTEQSSMNSQTCLWQRFRNTKTLHNVMQWRTALYKAL